MILVQQFVYSSLYWHTDFLHCSWDKFEQVEIISLQWYFVNHDLISGEKICIPYQQHDFLEPWKSRDSDLHY